MIEQFEGKRALVVGDVMIDRYLSGSVSRISPEAPVPVVQLENKSNRLGGAANVALNLVALGAQATLLSVVGDDENGELLRRMLPVQGIAPEALVIDKKRRTTVKTRIIAGSQHLLRCDTEDTHDLTAVPERQLLSRYERLLRSDECPDVIVLQDYNKGVLTRRVIQEMIVLARRLGIPTVADPKRLNFWAYRGVTLFKPNLKEINDALPFRTAATDRDSLRKAAQHLMGQLDCRYAFVTLSEHGVYLFGEGKEVLRPTRPRPIADVCGAGDTVLSVAALCMATEQSMETLCTLANMAGGQVCERVGVVPVDRETLALEYQREELS